MARNYAEIAFTPGVKALQERHGSRASYAKMEADPAETGLLTEGERVFIESRDTFFMASVNEDGWPYVQHRGGPPGFLQALDEQTLGFVDFRGNKQFISTGNVQHDDRVSLLLMDYANRQRLKIAARAEVFEAAERPDLVARLQDPDYRGAVERVFVLHIEAFDWNCPQHITPRFTEAEWRQFANN